MQVTILVSRGIAHKIIQDLFPTEWKLTFCDPNISIPTGVDLLLVVGRDAVNQYKLPYRHLGRIIEIPDVGTNWTTAALAMAGRFIREGKQDLHLSLVNGRLVAECLIPF